MAEAAHRYGYEGIELRLIDGELVSPNMSSAQRQRARRTIADAGLELCCVDTSFEIANPKASMEEALAYLDLAAELEGPTVRFFGGAPKDEPWNVTVHRTVERATELSEKGRSVGVTVAIETHDSFATGTALARALSAAPTDVGIIWDSLNPVVAGESPERTLAAVGDRLVHVHIKDGAVPPDLAENRLLGEGRVPVDTIIEMLVAQRYEGWLSVEWEKLWQPGICDPEIALPRYAEGIRALLERR